MLASPEYSTAQSRISPCTNHSLAPRTLSVSSYPQLFPGWTIVGTLTLRGIPCFLFGLRTGSMLLSESQGWIGLSARNTNKSWRDRIPHCLRFSRRLSFSLSRLCLLSMGLDLYMPIGSGSHLAVLLILCTVALAASARYCSKMERLAWIISFLVTTRSWWHPWWCNLEVLPQQSLQPSDKTVCQSGD